MSGGSMTKNQSCNGSAVYVNTGSASFSAGVIGGTGAGGNTASAGGAVGIGSANAVLRFTNTIRITGNKNGSGDAANVYLDQNSDNIIHVADLVRDNAETEALGAKIGIFVSDAQLHNRGIPGTKFAAYSGKDANRLDNNGNQAEISQESFKGIIENDRSDLDPIADTSVKRILWGKSIQVQVRYVSSYLEKRNNQWYAKLPPENAGNKVYPSSGNHNSFYTFYPASSDSALSEVADNLRSRTGFNPGTTAVFGQAFASLNDRFDQYLTRLYWDDTGSVPGWKLEKRDGNTIPCDKIVIFYTEPSYLSIENNSEEKITISNLSVLGLNAVNTKDSGGVSGQTGYGYVTARNGETRDALKPITAGDLSLEKGDSVKMLFPGAGASDDTYILNQSAYHLTGLIDGEVKQHKLYRSHQETGTQQEGRYYVNNINNSFDLTGARMYKGDTYEIIFENLKPICKIVSTATDTIEAGDTAGSVTREDGKKEYLFASISQAVRFAQNYLQSKAQIEMLTDYLLPKTDAVNFPKDCSMTLTTAVDGKKTYQNKDYSTSTDLNEVRALISRDSGNDNTLFKVSEGSDNTEVTLKRLRFDGKNLAGNINGGVLLTLDANVTVESCTFSNCVANNGGGMYIDYTIPQVQQTDENGNPVLDKQGKPVMLAGDTYSGNSNAALTVRNCAFNDCASKSTASRVGGGAVWTTAKKLNLIGCTFERCTSVDQGGAVFHRADTYIAGTETNVDNCRFSHCEARAAGAFESDTSSVDMKGCTFEHCSATQRNGGAFNVYSNNAAETNNDSKVSVQSCSFIDCHADNTASNYYGGALRSAAKETSVTGCTFENTSCMFGGAIAISNKYASKAEISGCEISYASAYKQGGGIYSVAKKTVVSDTSVKYCSTTGGHGGGIYHYSGAGAIIMKRTGIENCSKGLNVEYPYVGTETATVRRSYSGKSMFDVNSGNLTLETIQLDGNKNSFAVFGNGGIVTVGDVSSSSPAALTIEETAMLSHSRAAEGGAVYVTQYGTLTMNGGTIIENESTGNGAGIYLAEGSHLYLSGRANFGGTGVNDQGDLKPPQDAQGNFKTGPLGTARTNGGKEYLRARQDIFIAGHEGNDGDTTADSLVITGNLTSGAGTIWVWAEKQPHYKSFEQFAKYDETVTELAPSLAVFRNARPDDETGASQVGEYLHGTTKSDDTEGNAFWHGVEGPAHVTLVKVLQSGVSYQALSGKTFTVYTDRALTNKATGTILNSSGEEESVTLENLSSGTGGAFFIGELPYGTYYGKEDGVNGKQFEFAVNENGVITIKDYENKIENPDLLKELVLTDG